MRRNALFAAAIVGSLVASNSFAAFTFTTSRAVLASNPALERVNFLVGADTANISIAVLSLDITAIGAPNGLKFFVPGVGNPQAYPASDEASYTNNGTYTPAGGSAGNRLTYGGLPFGATTLGTPDPSLAANKALFQAGLPTINYASFLLSTFTAATADIGKYVLGSAVVPVGTAVSFGGNLQGDLNDNSTSTPFAITNGGAVVTNVAPVVLPTAPTPVVFGAVVSNGKTFSVTVNATDANATDVLSLALGAFNASDFIGTPTVAGGGVSPASFTISGTVAYSTGNRIINVPVNVSDGQGGVTPSTFSLVVTPEPASLAALGGAALMGLIRRRK